LAESVKEKLMPLWNEHKNYTTSGGRFQHFGRRTEVTYSVSETAEIFSVHKQTVMKWLQTDEDGAAVITSGAWFRMPVSGHIRIRESAILKLQEKT